MFQRRKNHKQKRSSRKRRNNLATKRRKNQERKGEKDQTSDDRLSDLPEPILRQILLCLPLAEAVNTRALSRRWQSVWTSCPILYFDEYSFGANYFEYFAEDLEKRERFAAFLQESLEKKKNCTCNYTIDKFGLRMASFDSGWHFVIDEWVNFVLEIKVKELDLRISRVEYESFKTFGLADSVFVAESVTVLFLEHCKIEPTCSINLPSLKKLSLSEVKIRDDVFNDLIIGCPLIEELCVEFCEGLRYIEVSIHNLKSMKLNFHGLVRAAIESLSLQSVEWSGDFRECDDVDLAAFKTVTDIALKNLVITDDALEYLVSMSPMLGSLVIDGCQKLKRIKVSCQLLKSFAMLRCRRIVAAEVDAPNLISLEYSGGMISFFRVNALRSLDAKINLQPTELDADWYIRLRLFLKQLVNSKLVTLICVQSRQ